MQNKKLSICIPNYLRTNCLEKLVRTAAKYIMKEGLWDQVEICISDDCSPEDPEALIEEIKSDYPQICIMYWRNETNVGMDRNFLKSVQVASGEFCWLVGNDDVITPEAFKILFEFWENQNTDFIVTPFNIHDGYGNFVRRISPVKDVKDVYIFDTHKESEYRKLITSIQHDSGIFAFLSNVVFRRCRWMEHGDMFEDKMNSIFIQVYMNLQTLKEGATYAYLNQSIIDEFADAELSDVTESKTQERVYKIIMGISGALDYFFEGGLRNILQRQVVDKCINACFWELPEEHPYRVELNNMNSERVRLLNQYYLSAQEQDVQFQDKRVIVYGAGIYGARVTQRYQKQGIDVIAICDQDVNKQGTRLNEIEICSLEDCKKKYAEEENVIFAIANMYYTNEIVKKLTEHDITRFYVVM